MPLFVEELTKAVMEFGTARTSPDQAIHAPGTTGKGIASPPRILAKTAAVACGSFAGKDA